MASKTLSFAEWSCGSCMTRNLGMDSVCRGCGRLYNAASASVSRTVPTAASAPRTAPRSAEPRSSDEKWTCHMCTVTNAGAGVKCMLCDAPRQLAPSSAAAAAHPGPTPAAPSATAAAADGGRVAHTSADDEANDERLPDATDGKAAEIFTAVDSYFHGVAEEKGAEPVSRAAAAASGAGRRLSAEEKAMDAAADAATAPVGSGAGGAAAMAGEVTADEALAKLVSDGVDVETASRQLAGATVDGEGKADDRTCDADAALAVLLTEGVEIGAATRAIADAEAAVEAGARSRLTLANIRSALADILCTYCDGELPPLSSDAEGGDDGGGSVVRLSCAHPYHKACLAMVIQDAAGRWRLHNEDCGARCTAKDCTRPVRQEEVVAAVGEAAIEASRKRAEEFNSSTMPTRAPRVALSRSEEGKATDTIVHTATAPMGPGGAGAVAGDDDGKADERPCDADAALAVLLTEGVEIGAATRAIADAEDAVEAGTRSSLSLADIRHALSSILCTYCDGELPASASDGADGGGSDGGSVVRLSCAHAYHKACLAMVIQDATGGSRLHDEKCGACCTAKECARPVRREEVLAAVGAQSVEASRKRAEDFAAEFADTCLRVMRNVQSELGRPGHALSSGAADRVTALTDSLLSQLSEPRDAFLIREAVARSGCIDLLLSRIGLIQGVAARLPDMVQDGGDAEIFASADGHRSGSAGADSGDPAAEERNRARQTTALMRLLLRFLTMPSRVSEDDGKEDEEQLLPNSIAGTIEASCLVPVLESLLSASEADIVASPESLNLHRAVWELLLLFARSSQLRHLLLSLPGQASSLYALSRSVEELAREAIADDETTTRPPSSGRATATTHARDVALMRYIVVVSGQMHDLVTTAPAAAPAAVPAAAPAAAEEKASGGDAGGSDAGGGAAGGGAAGGAGDGAVGGAGDDDGLHLVSLRGPTGDAYAAAMENLHVTEVPGDVVHHYAGDAACELTRDDIEAEWKARCMEELRDLRRTLPLFPGASILVRYYAGRPYLQKWLVSGPEGTPYAYGLFSFDVYCPPRYPEVPPSVHLLTTGLGRVRFNPCLYSNGRVCLGLLGSPHAPSDDETWDNTKNLYDVALAIQTKIFVAKPVYNEPGATEPGSRLSPAEERTSDNGGIEPIRLATIKHAVLAQLLSPPQDFAEAVPVHFTQVKGALLRCVNLWQEESRAPGEHAKGHKAGIAACVKVLTTKLGPLST